MLKTLLRSPSWRASKETKRGLKKWRVSMTKCSRNKNKKGMHMIDKQLIRHLQKPKNTNTMEVLTISLMFRASKKSRIS